MQSTSAELAAEILRTDRDHEPLMRLQVDWDRDGDFATVGTAGTSTNPSNLLPAADSLFETGIGNWHAAAGCTLARSGELAAEGAWAVKLIATGTELASIIDDANSAASAVAVAPGEVASIGAFIRAGAAGQLQGPSNRVAGTGGCTATSQITTQAGGVLQQMGIDAGAGTTPRAVPQTYTDYTVTGTFTAITWTVRPDVDPGEAAYLWAAQGTLLGGDAWQLGLRSAGVAQRLLRPDRVPKLQPVAHDEAGRKLATFRVLGATAAVSNTTIQGSFAQSFSAEGDGFWCGIPYAWVAGTTYTLRVAADTARGADWWAAYVTGPGGTSVTTPPTVVSSSSGNSAAGTWTGGTPVATSWEGGFTPQAGDLAILRQGYGGSTLTTTAPTDYTPLPGLTLPVTATDSNSRAYCWSKTLTVGESPPSFTPSGAQTGVWDLVVLRGVSGIGQVGTPASAGTATAIDLPTLTGVAAHSTLVGFVHHRVPAGSSISTGFTPDADYTERTDHATSRPTGTAQNVRGTAATRGDVAAGTYSGDTFTAAGGFTGSMIAFAVELLGITTGGEGGEQWVGSIKVPSSVGDLNGAVTQFTEWQDETTLASCNDIPTSTVFFGTPDYAPFGPGTTRPFRLVLRWLSSSRVYVSQTNGTAVSDSAAGWTEYKLENQTVPGGVAYVVPQIETTSVPAVGEAHFVDKVQIAKQATVGTWTGPTGGYTDDLSADVEACSVTRELATDLPPEVTRTQGLASASASIMLARQAPEGAPERDAAWYYSGWNPASPLASKRRKAAPAQVDFGFRTEDGAQYVRALTGRVRELGVQRGTRTATLELLDLAETMRRQVALPPILAEGVTEVGVVRKPGLNTTWLVDYVARQCGYRASPEIRERCVFKATLCGSAFPQRGSIQACHTEGDDVVKFTPTTRGLTIPARWVQAMHFPGSVDQFHHDIRYVLDTAYTLSPNNTRTLLFETWARFTTTAQDQPLCQVFRTGASTPWVTPWWQASTGSFCVSFNRAGADATQRVAVGPTVSPGGDWHYYAVFVSFTSAGVDVTFRYDSTTTGPVHVTTASVTGAGALNTIRLGYGPVSNFADTNLAGQLEAPQLTAELAAGTWNDGFVPTAKIGPASPDLLATPPITEEAWSIFQEIAAATYATAGFDEQGLFVYRTRRQLASAPYTVSQRTLTTTSSILDLASTESVDQIRNHIILKASIPQVADPVGFWRLEDKLSVPAGGSRTIWADFAQPVYNLDTLAVYSGDPNQGTRYLAGTARSGAGSQVQNLTITITPFAQSAKIVVSNPNAFTAYLTVDANAAAQFFGTVTGAPYLILNGQPVDFDAASGYRADVQDAASIAAYDEQLYEPADNAFRQVADDADELAADLLGMLKDPKPVLSDVPIVADPRLQLADRVTLQDPDGLVLDEDFHLAKITTALEGGALRQTVSLRAATGQSEEPPPPPPPPPPLPPPPPQTQPSAITLGWARNRPGDSGDWWTRMQAEITAFGAPEGCLHDYFSAGQATQVPTAGNESALAAGHRVLINLKPYPTGQGTNSWRYTADGNYDATLIAMFTRLKTTIATNNLAPDDLLVCYAHEPDEDVIGSSGTNQKLGTHADYRDMWVHLHNLMVTEGIRSLVKTVWLVMGWQKSLTQYGPNGFWPGNAPVDVVAHDPYIRAEETYDKLAFRIIDRSQWFRANAGADRAWGTLPILVGEFGCDLGGNTADYPTGDHGTDQHRADAFNDIIARLPEMVALGINQLNYFDSGSGFLSAAGVDVTAFAALKTACEAT